MTSKSRFDGGMLRLWTIFQKSSIRLKRTSHHAFRGLVILGGGILGFLGTASADEFPKPYDFEKNVNVTTPKDALGSMKLPEGFVATLYAHEPEVRQPIAMTFDSRGRLWVAECYTYAEAARNFDTKLRDRLVILEDTDGDGVHDRRKVFWDQGRKLTSVELGLGGVWVLCAPELLFIPDADQDDLPDGPPRVILDGWKDSAVRHNIVNGLRWGPDGWLYGRHGILETSVVGKPGASESQRTSINCGVWRYHPTRERFEAVLHGTTNPWGFDFNEHGELFLVNTVIGHLWHVVPGLRTERMFGSDFNPRSYQLAPQTADHFHWDTGEVWHAIRAGVSDSTSAAGGGHAHSGLMIYQGDNWPAVYRDKVFMLNFHGRRINVDRLERRGAGFVAKHEKDMIFWGDPWFRGLDLASGPDGSVFVLDWSDTGECHEHDGIHRSSGRVYKISHGKLSAKTEFNLEKATTQQLLGMLTAANNWWSRKAIEILRDRAARGEDLQSVQAELKRRLSETQNPTHAVRYLWALHACSGTSPDYLLPLFHHPLEPLRVWSVRFITDAWTAGDSPSESELEAVIQRVPNEPSGLVLLYMASALQRLPVAARWSLAEKLCQHSKFADDAQLPLLIWYGIEPAIPQNPARALRLAEATKIPKIRQFIARRLTEDLESSPAFVDTLLAKASSTDGDATRDILVGMSEALKGWARATKPRGWDAAQTRFATLKSAEIRQATQELGVLFGDGRTMAELQKQVENSDVEPEVRKQALRTLLAAKPEGFANQLLNWVADRAIGVEAIRGLALYENPQVPPKVLEQFPRLNDAERAVAVNTLVSRPAYAKALLEAIQAKQVSKQDLSAFHARQIGSFDDPALTELLRSTWGEARPSASDRRALIDDAKKRMTEDRLREADLSQGRAIFDKHCASCHVLFGQGKKVGPDLTGSNRKNLDYLLENLYDPSAVVGADFRASVLALEDGRTLTGVIVQQNDRTLTLQTAQEVLTLDRANIEEVRPTTNSLMPDGLLQTLSPDQVRDLFGYLMGTEQVAPAK
ncbi:MAG: PVC-type heme-binding CxxCH protein [Planctomycetota bacterium]